MASPMKDITSILNLKNQWHSTTDSTLQAAIANAAKPYYENLKNSGYENIATELSNSNYEQAYKIADKYGTQYKETPRQALGGYLSKYGITYDDSKTTYSDGTVRYDGMAIPAESYLSSEDRTYFEPGELEKFAQKYANATGSYRTDTMYGQEQESLNQKLDETYYNVGGGTDMTDPYSTDWGKNIMEQFKWEGDKAAAAATASAAGDNSGNIDSFAAANAARQQQSFTIAGNAAVEAARRERVNDVLSVLDRLGVNTQRIFDNSQTAALNDASIQSQKVADDLKVMATTGMELPEYSSNPFIGAQFDIMEKINELVAQGRDYNTDPLINQLKEARAYKIKNSTDSKINTLPFDSYTPSSKQTASYLLELKALEQAYDLKKYELDREESMLEKQLAAKQN